MNTFDTSVVIAACASWHEWHGVARRAVEAGGVLVGHVALEAYSVLTRLPVPHRIPADIAREYLVRTFPKPPLVLDAAAMLRIVPELENAGIAGGAVYDGLIAITARTFDATLVTLDDRALPTYRKCGASVRRLDVRSAAT